MDRDQQPNGGGHPGQSPHHPPVGYPPYWGAAASASSPHPPPFYPGFPYPPPPPSGAGPSAEENKVYVAKVKMALPKGLQPCDSLMKASIDRLNEDGSKYTVAQFSRKAVEGSPEFLLRASTIIEEVRKLDKGSILLSYGDGLYSIVLLNTDTLPSDMNTAHSVSMKVVVVGESVRHNDARLLEYGYVDVSDPIHNHIRDAYSTTGSANVWLVPGDEAVPEFNDQDEVHVFELKSNKASGHENTVAHFKRSHKLEQKLKRLNAADSDMDDTENNAKKTESSKASGRAKSASAKRKPTDDSTAAASKKAKTVDKLSGNTAKDNVTDTGVAEKDAGGEAASPGPKKKKRNRKKKANANAEDAPEVSASNKGKESDPKPAEKNPQDEATKPTLAKGSTTVDTPKSPKRLPSDPAARIGFNPTELIILEKAFEGKTLNKKELNRSANKYDARMCERAIALAKSIHYGIKREKKQEAEKAGDEKSSSEKKKSEKSSDDKEEPKQKKKSEKSTEQGERKQKEKKGDKGKGESKEKKLASPARKKSVSAKTSSGESGDSSVDDRDSGNESDSS